MQSAQPTQLLAFVHRALSPQGHSEPSAQATMFLASVMAALSGPPTLSMTASQNSGR
jgi:hypothetical protein